MDGDGLRLNMNGLDYLILALYFVTVLGVGFAARRAIRTSVDFFLSGRSLPAWVTGLAFVSANLGALEIIGMAANGAQYGVMTVHYYWIGAVPAMVFLGIVMMPFYYGSKVRSVPEYLRLRFNRPTHLLNALSFAVAQVLIAGVNLYALALVMQALLGWPLWTAIVVGAAIVLAYITIGGLSGAIYNEVLQFFVILAGLIPVTVIGLVKVGGWNGLMDAVGDTKLGEAGLHAWAGHRQHRQPAGRALDRHRLRPRLRAVVRLLDDELRRGAAGPLGQEHERRPAYADHRRVPEVVHPPGHRHPRPGGPGHGEGPRRGERRPAVQQRHPAADARPAPERRARGGGHRPARLVHGRHGGQRERLQHRLHLRHLAGVRPP